MLPPLHQLSLHGGAAPLATGVHMDDPELQGAIEVFTRIWADAGNEATLTPMERAQQMCRNLDVVRRISTQFVPANFYKHYAVHLEIPGANQWADNDPAGTFAELLRYCRMVHTPVTATEAARAALETFPGGFDEAMWLAAHGADYWSMVRAFMYRFARMHPHMWLPMLGGGPSPAASRWNRLLQALGGQQAVDASFANGNAELVQAYGAIARLDNVAAMQLFQITFARGITPLSRESVALNLHGGQIAPLSELIVQEVAHITALQANPPDTRHLQNIMRNGAQAMARNHVRALAHSATTPFQDIATLAQRLQNQPHVHSQLFVGALQGLPDAETLPAYVNAYYQPGLQPRQLLNLLTRFLGERVTSKRDWFPFANDAKFRSLVQALPAGAIDASMRNRLLSVAAGTQGTQIADETGPPGWEMRRMHSVLAMFGGQRFGLSDLCRAMDNTFFHLSGGTPEAHPNTINERVQVLAQLVALLPPACVPAQPNDFPAVHRAANRTLQDLYNNHIWYYVRPDGPQLPDNAEYLARAFRDTVRVFTNAGITLGHQPAGALVPYAPHDIADFDATERLVRGINTTIWDLDDETVNSPEHGQIIQAKRAFAEQLLALIPP